MQSSSSSTDQSSSKIWEASFGRLTSSYDFSGNVPSLPKKTKSATKNSRASISSDISSQSTIVESRTKDYEATFGKLSSAYGFGGGVPSLPSRTSKTCKTTKIPSSSSPPSTVRHASKDYQRAYGELSSAYGFGASVPYKS